MKRKILFICCFILLLCGCSTSKEKKVEEELLTDNDFGFTIILDDGLGLHKGFQIKNINDYIFPTIKLLKSYYLNEKANS